MKKGFTLVELLGVLVILGLLALITVPIITNSINSSKKNLKEVEIKNIVKAAKDWAADNMDKLPSFSPETSGSCNVSIETLVSGGYIDQPINPDTNVNFGGCVIISVDDNNYSYSYQENSSNCSCGS